MPTDASAAAPSGCSTRAWAASRSCTSCSSPCRTRTSSTSGDSARFPYGPRSPGELEGFALEIARGAARRGAKLLVVACNSATAAALPALQERSAASGVDVIGVVSPESQAAAGAPATAASACSPPRPRWRSGAYERAIAAADPHVRLTSVACPDLAPIIQRGSPSTTRCGHRPALLRARCARRRSTRSSSAARTIRWSARCSSGCSAATSSSSAPAPRSPARSSTRSAAAAWASRRSGRGRATASCARATRGVPRAGHPLPAAAARPGVEHVDVDEVPTVMLELPRARGGRAARGRPRDPGPWRRAHGPLARPRGRRAAAGGRSSPASCGRPPARR